MRCQNLRRLASLLALGAIALLAGCSALKLTYNNADVLARFRVSDYVDFTPAQLEQFKARFAVLHRWHRSQELPAYVGLLQGASQKLERGLTAQDVAWAIDNARSRYRKMAARAAADAAPIVVTLSPQQLQQVEKRFAENNRKYADDQLEGNPQRLHYKRTRQLEDYFKEWIGSLSDAQSERIERFTEEYGRMQALRLDDRKRTQQAALVLMRAERDPVKLAPRLAALFDHPDEDRSADFHNAELQYETAVAALIVDVDKLLTPQQRTRAHNRVLSYAEDLATLSATTTVGMLELLAGL